MLWFSCLWVNLHSLVQPKWKWNRKWNGWDLHDVTAHVSRPYVAQAHSPTAAVLPSLVACYLAWYLLYQAKSPSRQSTYPRNKVARNLTPFEDLGSPIHSGTWYRPDSLTGVHTPHLIYRSIVRQYPCNHGVMERFSHPWRCVPYRFDMCPAMGYAQKQKCWGFVHRFNPVGDSLQRWLT